MLGRQGKIEKKEVVQRLKDKTHLGVCQNFINEEVPKQNCIEDTINSVIYSGSRINVENTKVSEAEQEENKEDLEFDAIVRILQCQSLLDQKAPRSTSVEG